MVYRTSTSQKLKVQQDKDMFTGNGACSEPGGPLVNGLGGVRDYQDPLKATTRKGFKRAVCKPVGHGLTQTWTQTHALASRWEGISPTDGHRKSSLQKRAVRSRRPRGLWTVEGAGGQYALASRWEGITPTDGHRKSSFKRAVTNR